MSGRGPIHLLEFTLANYPWRMENGQGLWGQEPTVIVSAHDLCSPLSLPEEIRLWSAQLPFLSLTNFNDDFCLLVKSHRGNRNAKKPLSMFCSEERIFMDLCRISEK